MCKFQGSVSHSSVGIEGSSCVTGGTLAFGVFLTHATLCTKTSDFEGIEHKIIDFC